MEAALEATLPSTEQLEDDAAARHRLVAAATNQAGFYSPWLHLAAPSLTGFVIIASCASLIHQMRPIDWLFALGVFLFSNTVEWHNHKDLLHHRFWPLGVLYDRHTPLHHRVYVKGAMAMKDPREFRLVLLPAYGIAALLLVTAPPAALIYWAGYRNFGALYLLVTTAYTVLYEWLHLSYHLPDSALHGPLRVLRSLRQHHETHHDPRLMQRWNFNVTVPFWDLVRGTIWKPPAPQN